MRHRVAQLLPEPMVFELDVEMQSQITFQLFVHVVRFLDVPMSDDDDAVPSLIESFSLRRSTRADTNASSESLKSGKRSFDVTVRLSLKSDGK